MSRTLSMVFDLLPGTRAGVGRTSTKTLIANRPDGAAGGQGLGFNGAEFFAAALGGCFRNDLHYAAEARGIQLHEVQVEVKVTLDGQPLRIVAAWLGAYTASDDPEGGRSCFEDACAASIIANSVSAAFPVRFGHYEA